MQRDHWVTWPLLAVLCVALAPAVGQDAPDAEDQPDGQGARFVRDKWVYYQQVTSPGRPDETRHGVLEYDGRQVAVPGLHDYVQTPWGTMYFWGDRSDKGRSGWLLSQPPEDKIGNQISPDAKTAGSDRIDLTRTATYARKQWRYEYEIRIVPGGGKIGTGKLYFADKAVEARNLRDYVRTPWGVMYNWGADADPAGAEYRGWVPKIAIGRPGRRIRVGGRRIEQISLDKPGDYESGQWQYSYDIHAKGTRSEGRSGKLLYKGKAVQATAAADYVRTPWGVMFWWPRRERPWGNQGWLPVVPGARMGKLITPDSEDGTIDLAKPGAYQKGHWSYVYTIWARGTETEGSAGQLYYKDKPVKIGKVGDHVQTPWGRMYRYEQLGVSLKGPHGWIPIAPDGQVGQPVDPAQEPVEKLDLSAPATYTAGLWKFSYTLWKPGADAQGRLGQLTYDGRNVTGKVKGDVIRTPWGKLWWWGDLTDALRGNYGWLPAEPERPTGRSVEPPDSSGLDLTTPGTFQKDQWKYVYLCWGRGTDRAGRSGRLYFASAEVKARAAGDYVRTPWGTMYFWGVPSHAQGDQGWLPVKPEDKNGSEVSVTRSQEKIDLTVPAAYSFADWRYVYATWAHGTRSAGSVGELFYRHKAVADAAKGDWIDTPWGKIYYHGPMDSTFGRYGWMPIAPEKTTGRQIPLAELQPPAEAQPAADADAPVTEGS